MNTDLLLAFGGLLFFGLLIFFAVQHGKRREEQRRRIVQSLGFTPLETNTTLTDRVNHFYNWDESKPEVALSNVSRKILPDGEIYLFDLNDSDSEKQVVAILSSDLNLPKFRIFPRLEVGNAAGKLVNKALIWAISQVETPLEFPDVPDFHKQYMASSPDPDSARHFLDTNLLQELSQIKQCVVQAGGNMFVFSLSTDTRNPVTHEALSQRIDKAMRVFWILRSAGEYDFGF